MTQVAVTDFHKKITIALDSINQEFEEHLLAINENTQEVQENYTYMIELDNKIAKLNERINDIYDILSSLSGKKIRKMPRFEDIDPLSGKEKNIFLHLYTEEKPITFSDLAKKMSMPISILREHIMVMIEKGIPVQKTYKNTRPFIMLDRKFKNLQAKKNILKIEQKILL